MKNALLARYLLTSALLAAAAVAHTAPTVSCHCFRDRSFSTEAPFAADAYVLATGQNSLLAAVYGIPKKDVVRAKMTGTPGDALWVARELGRRSGRDADELLRAREEAGSWIPSVQGLPTDPGSESLRRAAASNDADAALASAVVDGVLQARLGLSPEAVAGLTAADAAPAERIAAALLHRLQQGEPAELLARVRSGSVSWGALFHAAGVEPEAIDEVVPRLLR